MTPWQILGVAPDVAVADLRRRYAALIKEFRPETHPQDFARIREAYEAVLPIARRREAEAFEAAEAQAGEPDDGVAADEAPAPPEDPHPPEAIDEPPDVEQEIATGDAAQPGSDEPDLATCFHRFHEVAEAAAGTRDEAFLPGLRALLKARASASLDDSQALEFALLRWFIESDQPPLTLLFEAGRTFDWHLHPARLSSWLSPWALRQMEARLSLSRDLVYARHFSGNARLRALHAPTVRGPLVVFRPATLEAQHWVQRWSRLCDEAKVAAIGTGPAERARAHLRAFASTDALAGLLLALPLAPDAGSAAVSVVAIGAVAWAGRRALQAVAALPPSNRIRAALRAVMGNRLFTGIVAALLAIAGIATIVEYQAVGILFLTPAIFLGSGVILAALWRGAAWLELAAVTPTLWREAVDRLEFDRMLRGRAKPDATLPFGVRLGFGQRFRTIREAWRLQARELTTRERPPRARPFVLARLQRGGSGTDLWRVVWYGGWVLFVVARLVHAFGQ